MRLYLTAFLLVSSVVFLSCSTVKKSTYSNYSIESPLPGGTTSALYKANIKVFGNFFSGLVYFKCNSDENDCNIVLLSEVGLTLCDFYSANDSIRVTSASSLFSNKKAQQILAEDFGYLLHSPGLLKQLSEYNYKNEDNIQYTIKNTSEIQQIRKKRIVNGVVVDLDNYNDGVPCNINFKHRGINLNMKLTLLKMN